MLATKTALCVCCNTTVDTNDRTPCSGGKQRFDVISLEYGKMGELSNNGGHLFFDLSSGKAKLERIE